MADAATNIAAEQFVEHSAYGALLSRDGNRGPTAAPQNLYLTRSDREDEGESWIAIAVATESTGRRCETPSVARPGRWTQRCWSSTCARREASSSTAIWRPGAANARSDEILKQLWDVGHPGGEGVAAASTRRAGPAPVPRLLRVGRASRRRLGAAQHPADAIFHGPGNAFTSGTRRCSASTPVKSSHRSGVPAAHDRRAGGGQRDRNDSDRGVMSSRMTHQPQSR